MEIPAMTYAETEVSDLNVAMEVLYERAFPPFARFAARRSASLDDAKDVFHDALVIFFEQRNDPGRAINSSPEAYVVGIAKHLWFRRFRGKEDHLELPGDNEIQIPDDYFPGVNELRLLRFLEHAGKKCMDLLHRFYYERAGLRDIAASLGFRSEHSAAVQKYKCIGRLRDAVKAKSLKYDDFLF